MGFLSKIVKLSNPINSSPTALLGIQDKVEEKTGIPAGGFLQAAVFGEKPLPVNQIPESADPRNQGRFGQNDLGGFLQTLLRQRGPQGREGLGQRFSQNNLNDFLGNLLRDVDFNKGVSRQALRFGDPRNTPVPSFEGQGFTPGGIAARKREFREARDAPEQQNNPNAPIGILSQQKRR